MLILYNGSSEDSIRKIEEVTLGNSYDSRGPPE